MSRIDDSSLVVLVNKLTKSEKRYFNLSQHNNATNKESLFFQLFQLIEKDGYLDKQKALTTIPGLKLSQISNQKNQLYHHILESLRMFHKNNSIELSLRAAIDSGKILYNKSLYNQSLKILNKAKQKALKYNLYSIALEIIEFEKYIESQHITNAKEHRAYNLIHESEKIKTIVDNINTFQNLSLSLYDLYLKQGIAKNEEKHEYIKAFFEERTKKDISLDTMTFFEKMYYIQANVWYCYMIQDLEQYYYYSNYWVTLFKNNPLMIVIRPTLYLKGLHNLLTGQYNTSRYYEYLSTLEELDNIEINYSIRIDQNRRSLKALYYYMHKIDLYFWTGEYQDGIIFINKLEVTILNKVYQWDIYRELNFYFKIASMYFGNNNHDKTLLYLNKIINHQRISVRQELYGYAMILQAMTQFELGNMIHIEYLIKSIFRHLKLKENLQLVESAILHFIKKMPSLTPDNYLDSFKNFKYELQRLQTNKYERRAFHYLDIISWLESHIEKKSVSAIVKAKFGKNNNSF